MIGPTLRLFDGFDHTSPQLRDDWTGNRNGCQTISTLSWFG